MTAKIVEFKLREKEFHEKMRDVLGSGRYVTFWFDETQALHHAFGESLQIQELTYIGKILDMMNTETILDKTFTEDET